MSQAKEWAHVGRTSIFRRGRVAAAVLVLALVAGACGGGGDSSSEETTSEPGGGGSAAEQEGGGGFPVTIEHAFGETTIEERPERVVTVGLTDHDAVLALGVVPVGVTDWFGEQPHATWPWAQDELGDAEPEIVGDAATLNYESIAALEPDVILALYA